MGDLMEVDGKDGAAAGAGATGVPGQHGGESAEDGKAEGKAEPEKTKDGASAQAGPGDVSMADSPALTPSQEREATGTPVAGTPAAASLGNEEVSKPKKAGKLVAQYKVTCLNCGQQLYIELPPNCVNFQCCQCYAVHKVIQPDPALAAEENRKRKRKDRKGGGPETRELTGYNKFMREELAAIRENSPSLDNREAYKLALSKWAVSEENPKVAAAKNKEAREEQERQEAAGAAAAAAAAGAAGAATAAAAAAQQEAAPPAAVSPAPAGVASNPDASETNGGIAGASSAAKEVPAGAGSSVAAVANVGALADGTESVAAAPSTVDASTLQQGPGVVAVPASSAEQAPQESKNVANAPAASEQQGTAAPEQQGSASAQDSEAATASTATPAADAAAPNAASNA